MRHRKKGRKLNRTASHRKALMRNLANQLIEHKEIYSTCKSGDAAAAGKAVRYNVQQTVKGILTKLSAGQKDN